MTPGMPARCVVTCKPDHRNLTPEEREEARKCLAEGRTLRQVAEHFGLSRMAIWRLPQSHPRRDGLEGQEVMPRDR